MAVFVPMQDSQGDVTARIRIKGNVFWHFLYAADGGELPKNGTSSDPTDYDLGAPEKLNMDVNTWHIAVMNPNKATVSFAIDIAWLQGEDVIATWPDKGPMKGSLKPGDTSAFDDSALLAIVPEETA